MQNAPASAASANATQDAELVTTASVSCDGGGGSLGHPAIYLSFGHKTELACPYCSKTFRLAPGAKIGHGH